MVATFTLPLALLLFQDETAPPLTTKRHVVQSLLAQRGSADLGLDLCARRISEKGGQEADFGSGRPLLGINELRDLVFSCVIHDSKHEVRIDPDGDALRVTADAEVQGEVERIVRELGGALDGEEQIELRVLHGELVDLDAPALLDRKEADRREAQLARGDTSGVWRSGRIHTSGGAGRLFDLDETTYLMDYEVEIAHGAELFDPIVATLSTGLTAVARASRSAGGVLLDLAVGMSEPAGPMRERLLRPKLWLTSPLSIRSDQARGQDPSTTGGTIVTGPVPLKIEIPSTRCLGVAGTFLIPDGKALWIPCRVDTTSGSFRFVLDVRADGAARPQVRHLARNPDWKVDRFLLRVPSVERTGIELQPFGGNSLRPGLSWQEGDETWWPSRVTLAARDPGDIEERLRQLVVSQPDAYLAVQRLGGEWWLALSQVPLDDATLHSIETAFAPPAASASLEIEGCVERGDDTIARFSLPLLAGASATIWSGVSSSFVAGWGVDVAGDTAIGNPDVGAYLDGFALAFVANPIGAARMQLDVRGAVNLLDGPPVEKSLENPCTPSIDDVKATRLFVDETRNATGERGVFKFRFGGAPLALEFTVTRK